MSFDLPYFEAVVHYGLPSPNDVLLAIAPSIREGDRTTTLIQLNTTQATDLEGTPNNTGNQDERHHDQHNQFPVVIE